MQLSGTLKFFFLMNHLKRVLISLLWKIEKCVKNIFFPIKNFLKQFTNKKSKPLSRPLTFPIEKKKKKKIILFGSNINRMEKNGMEWNEIN